MYMFRQIIKNYDCYLLMYVYYKQEFIVWLSFMKKIATIFLILFSTVFLAWCGEQKDPNSTGQLNSFAQCVSQKGLKMYGTDRCPHCKKMKALFGSAFSGVQFINCDEQKVQCDAAGIEWYPTFSFNWKKYQWEKTLQELSTLTSCDLPK